MGKKSFKIKEKVDASGLLFYNYLSNILDDETYFMLEEISKITSLLIFSGVIRNFFLNRKDFRDIDIVLEQNIDLEIIFRDAEITKNSFGGYKIQMKNIKIDLWYLQDTWALKFQPPIFPNLNEYVPYTAFFNFSAIVFDYKQKKFIYTNEFLKFLVYKKIDFVYKPNVNNTLCIVNTFYYSKKYNLKIANRLVKYIIELNKVRNRNYEAVQKKHFGEILFTTDQIQEKIISLSAAIVKN